MRPPAESTIERAELLRREAREEQLLRERVASEIEALSFEDIAELIDGKCHESMQQEIDGFAEMLSAIPLLSLRRTAWERDV